MKEIVMDDQMYRSLKNSKTASDNTILKRISVMPENIRTKYMGAKITNTATSHALCNLSFVAIK